MLGRYYVLLNRKSVKKYAEEEDYSLDFLRMKVAMNKENFNALKDEMKNYAFTVAHYENENQISEILSSVIDAKEKDLSFDEWKSNISEKNLKVDDIVYHQNIRASEMSGKYMQFMEDADIAPYLEYISQCRRTTRPEHLALHGTIRRYDDPLWDKWFPPNGFECVCDVRSLSAAYLRSKGIDVDKIGSGNLTREEALKNLEAVKERRANRLNKIDDEENKSYDKWLDNEIETYKNSNNRIVQLQQAKGFNNNSGKDLYNWVKAKETPRGDEKNIWSVVTNKKINLKNELKNIEATKIEKFDVSGDIAKKLKESLSSITNDSGIAFDKYNIPVNIGELERFVEHLKKDKTRLSLLNGVKECITNPDMIVGNVVVSNKKAIKKGMTKIGRIYIKKVAVDEKEYFLQFVSSITNTYNKNYTGWTLIPSKEIDGIIISK